MTDADATQARRALVDRLRGGGWAFSDAVLGALARVPREAFVPPGERRAAYEDAPLPIGGGQTISAPHMVAMMVEALDLRPGQRVLEVGGGSGYHAAVIAEVVGAEGHVWSVERVPALAARAREQLAAAGYGARVTVVDGDGAAGLPAEAPFDRVSVACAAPAPPPPLVEQIAPGGRLLVPLGDLDVQELTLVEKEPGGRLFTRGLGPCRFVPLTGPYGFRAASDG